ncbi:DarT ssDNA thymidine ADP-ribosyltransferase family protein [Flavobacterium ovatum]|uniref:DarT ssDNA thymidine ADP-ribosyltransferase family protein n=1 Tax=Flavobacterium ovatum TaxID=1928857 RepID=UPI00344C6D98
MTFFNKIWGKIKNFFWKKKYKTDNEIYLDAIAIVEIGVNKAEIYKEAKNTEDENERKKILKPITEFEKAKKIIEIIEQDSKLVSRPKEKKKRKRLFEIHELEKELSLLEEKLTLLNFTESQIKTASYPDTSSLDKRIHKMVTQLSINKINNKIELAGISISKFEKSFQELETILTNNSTLQKHTTRENIKLRQEEIYKNQTKQKLSTLENLINQNKLVEVKVLINQLEISIKPTYQKELARLTVLKEKYKEKELQVFKKQQEELLKKQAEQAKILKEEEEKRYEVLKLKRELELIKKKHEEDKRKEKENKLKALLNKKANWRDFQRVLQENGISTLYHFTAKSNLKSIKENGGLYSWYHCDIRNIVIPMTGNSALGRSLDESFGLEDFVRLSFVKDHPMKHVAMREGRITNPILLQVSIEVCYFENTRFSNMNATDNRHENNDTIEFIESLRFDLFSQNYFDLDTLDKKRYQAEVLVKTWIPIEHITNINSYN